MGCTLRCRPDVHVRSRNCSTRSRTESAARSLHRSLEVTLCSHRYAYSLPDSLTDSLTHSFTHRRARARARHNARCYGPCVVATDRSGWAIARPGGPCCAPYAASGGGCRLRRPEPRVRECYASCRCCHCCSCCCCSSRSLFSSTLGVAVAVSHAPPPRSLLCPPPLRPPQSETDQRGAAAAAVANGAAESHEPPLPEPPDDQQQSALSAHLIALGRWIDETSRVDEQLRHAAPTAEVSSSSGCCCCCMSPARCSHAVHDERACLIDADRVLADAIDTTCSRGSAAFGRRRGSCTQRRSEAPYPHPRHLLLRQKRRTMTQPLHSRWLTRRRCENATGPTARRCYCHRLSVATSTTPTTLSTPLS